MIDFNWWVNIAAQMFKGSWPDALTVRGDIGGRQQAITRDHQTLSISSLLYLVHAASIVICFE